MRMMIITPNQDSEQARRDMKSEYEMHRTLTCTASPDEHNRTTERILFRFEEGRVIVQSNHSSAAFVLPFGWWRQVDLIEPTASTIDRTYGFRLRANAVKTMSKEQAEYIEQQGGTVRHHIGRSALRDPSLLEGWLTAQGERCGFEVLHLERPRQRHIKAKPGATILATDFRGILRVTDPERLAEARRQGIGKAKAFGCGLLMLRDNQGWA